MAIILKNADVIDCWLTASSKNKISALLNYVEQQIGNSNYDKKQLLKKISFFNSVVKKLWRETKCNRNIFEIRHSKWLTKTFFHLDDVSFI